MQNIECLTLLQGGFEFECSPANVEVCLQKASETHQAVEAIY